MSVFDNWQGTIEINGTSQSIEDVKGAVSIHLYPIGYQKHTDTTPKRTVETVNDSATYLVKVRAWMTKESTPDFDFMDKFNKGIPMPFRVMVGTINKETEKMYQMTLHGDIVQEVSQTCMCCGKPITNDVSKYFGMGPVCGNHNYVNPFATREELRNAVKEYRARLQKVVWEGWIPKSAIEEMKKYE